MMADKYTDNEHQNTQKLIRVLQVGMSPYYGGTESFIMSQYRCIDRSKVQFDFLNVYDTALACQEEIIRLGGNIYYLNMERHKGIRSYYHHMTEFFEKNAENFDVVHCNYQSLINVDILKYSKKYNIPTRIAHAHNAGYGTEPSVLQKALIRRNRKILLQSATHYFACSELAAKWMFNRDAIIIKNAININNFVFEQSVRERVRNEMKLGNGPTFIFVGRLDPQKNPLFLIEVFKEILFRWPKAQLLIVGDGVLRQELEEKVREVNITGSVKMLGTRTDINELLQAADAFLLPSRFEGLGIVLIEAQAAGLPCFASKDVIPAEVDATGLVNFISLDEPANIWADNIIERMSCGYTRHTSLEKLCEAGYDSKTNSRKLEQFYLHSVGEV